MTACGYLPAYPQRPGTARVLPRHGPEGFGKFAHQIGGGAGWFTDNFLKRGCIACHRMGQRRMGIGKDVPGQIAVQPDPFMFGAGGTLKRLALPSMRQ
jgi:hypothetical protein